MWSRSARQLLRSSACEPRSSTPGDQRRIHAEPQRRVTRCAGAASSVHVACVAGVQRGRGDDLQRLRRPASASSFVGKVASQRASDSQQRSVHAPRRHASPAGATRWSPPVRRASVSSSRRIWLALLLQGGLRGVRASRRLLRICASSSARSVSAAARASARIAVAIRRQGFFTLAACAAAPAPDPAPRRHRPAVFRRRPGARR